MSELSAPRVGSVLSADIAVPEHERMVRFYSRVLGTGESPLWREGTLLNNLGVPIIGLGERSAQHADLPLQWMPHIQVADVGAGVQRALELGGNVLMQDEGKGADSGWAVLLDTGGAAFGIIPVAPEQAVPADVGTGLGDPSQAVGRIVWLDLTVPDASATREFYRQVIGWSVQDVEMNDGGEPYADYNMLGGNGQPAAGVCHARGMNDGLPPVWMIYLPVGDLGDSLRRVEEEGGRIIRGVRGDDGQYIYAAIEDPVGACLALVPG